MFCNQCQEAAKNVACTTRGVCGKDQCTAALQHALVFALRGLAYFGNQAAKLGLIVREHALFIAQGLFATITNANFDDRRFVALIREAIRRREGLKAAVLSAYRSRWGRDFAEALPAPAIWNADSVEEFRAKGASVSPLATADPNIRALNELILNGLRGLSAYADHAAILGCEDDEVYQFLMHALVATAQSLSAHELTALLLKTGEIGVKGMALLDKANTGTYGHPEMTRVNLGVRNNPGILVSGHDLRDLENLLKQTEGTGVDIYTHCEMLPAHSYPAFKKHSHLAGNYGNAWWQQDREFEMFNGPILMTTNCLIPVKDAYQHRIFTTGITGYPGIKHIPDRVNGQPKDFSPLIALAKTCPPPKPIESGALVGGFAHHQVTQLADEVVGAVKSGAIKRFVVMAGCDGRHKTRQYYTDVASNLPKDTVILTAGCAKFRYNKLPLGEIGGIPRVLDAGQCNDSYSLVLIALKLKEAFGLKDINDLPLSFDLAWYEQKAVIVLLALLHLGVKGIRLGPTLPAFLSPDIVKVLVEKFGLKPIGDAKHDLEAIMAGA